MFKTRFFAIEKLSAAMLFSVLVGYELNQITEYLLLFIENILEVLVGLGLKINIGHDDSFRRILKTNIRRYEFMTHFVVN